MRKIIVTKNKLGFSLLELMVVVAIIGVLATFAVPRFNIFRARARQSEAKSNLGVIFTLQEAFKIDKEKYYDGVGGGSGWGGANMKGYDNRVGYNGGGTHRCGSAEANNKLGFRLANCEATRYGYYVTGADEDNFMVYAAAESDAEARIFPGCNGETQENNKPSTSPSGKRKCDTSGTNPDETVNTNTGDAFCLDQVRTVDNFVDIVGSETCTD